MLAFECFKPYLIWIYRSKVMAKTIGENNRFLLTFCSIIFHNLTSINLTLTFSIFPLLPLLTLNLTYPITHRKYISWGSTESTKQIWKHSNKRFRTDPRLLPEINNIAIFDFPTNEFIEPINIRMKKIIVGGSFQLWSFTSS